ncbi:MAG TPA: hypothetical protein VMT23_01605 [Candidatus Binatia bacterium]|nr:hypothetical protein [Candidatus Binatia bacterium]
MKKTKKFIRTHRLLVVLAIIILGVAGLFLHKHASAKPCAPTTDAGTSDGGQLPIEFNGSLQGTSSGSQTGGGSQLQSGYSSDTPASVQ